MADNNYVYGTGTNGAVQSFDMPKDNIKRDLLDTLSVILQNSPNFITNFPLKGFATNRKHEWLEEWVRPKTIVYSSATTAGVFTIANAGEGKISTAGWAVGDYVHIQGDPAVFKVTALTSNANAENTITVSFIASNGSSITGVSGIPTTAGILCYDSHPINEASIIGPSGFEQSVIEYNSTQIFRREVVMSGTALAVNTYGNENTMDHQIERAMYRIAQDLNHAALYGVRKDRDTTGAEGMLGGLYYYGGDNGLEIAVENSAPLDLSILNDAAQKLTDAGANPSMILCAPIMCRVISALNHDNVTIMAQDATRGSYVARIVNDSTGAVMTVHAEPEMIQNEVWVIDPSGFGCVPLQGRGITSFDTTERSFDGMKETILGELTLEFKNAKQKLCRIKGLEDPNTTINRDIYTKRVIVKSGNITTTASSNS